MSVRATTTCQVSLAFISGHVFTDIPNMVFRKSTAPSPAPSIAQFPHCDQAVLHAPGECSYCDSHPDWQELREVWNINYTGHNDPQKTPCPAEARRPVGVINRWSGNVPTNVEILEVIDEEPDAV